MGTPEEATSALRKNGQTFPARTFRFGETVAGCWVAFEQAHFRKENAESLPPKAGRRIWATAGRVHFSQNQFTRTLKSDQEEDINFQNCSYSERIAEKEYDRKYSITSII
uniref:Uncharacterized protein n=1 Tax=Trichuris muris TaxID=70415 RepID=A0A5S6Q9R9_TRIMR